MNLYCSFCHKSNEEVKTLIAAPNAYICEECVLLCIQILAGEARKKAHHKQTDYYKWARRKTAND